MEKNTIPMNQYPGQVPQQQPPQQQQPPLYHQDASQSQMYAPQQQQQQQQPMYGSSPPQPQGPYTPPAGQQPAYGQPAQHQQPYMQPPQHAGTQPLPQHAGTQLLPQHTQTGPVYQNATPIASLNRSPAPADCPACGARALTSVSFEIGNTTHAWALALCCLALLGCIPYLMNSTKDVQHKCGKCGVLLATWHRSGTTEVHIHG